MTMNLIKAKVWLLGKCDLCGTPIDRIEREGTTVWHFHVAPEPVSGMPHTPTPGCTCHPTDESTWTRYGDAVEPGSMWEPDPECPEHGAHTEILTAQEGRGDAQPSGTGSDRGTGVSEVHMPPQAFPAQLTIPADMIGIQLQPSPDFEPALIPNEAMPSLARFINALKARHYLDAAASIRKLADADENAEPPIGGEVNYLLGMRRAADRLESTARDLDEEPS